MLVVATLAVAAWWLWNLDAGGGPRTNEEIAAESAPTAPRRVDSRPDIPAASEPAKPATETTPQPEASPEANPKGKPEAAAYDEPGITPVYGDLLKRGGAVITFDLRDAQGQWLIDESVSVRLIRRLGRFSINESCHWVFDDGVILCDGESSAGLEPGTYELEVEAGRYGWKRHTFTVQRGEKAMHELRLPYWRRIITCHFNDLQGNPLPFLTSPPNVETKKIGAPDDFYAQGPEQILRKPPTPGMGGGGGRGGKGGFAYRRARGSGGLMVYPTDGGKWYMAVFAGAPNTISAEGPASQWPGENLLVDGTFDSAADAKVEFRLAAPADLDAEYAKHFRMNADDPGQRSLLAWAERKGALAAADDPADEFSGARIVVDLGESQGLEPRLLEVEKDDKGAELPRRSFGGMVRMNRRGGLWYAQAAQGREYWLVIGSERDFEAEPERIKVNSRVTRLDRKPPAGVDNVLPWNLVPTLDAWAIHREAALFTPTMDLSVPLLRVDYAKPALLVPPAARAPATAEPELALKWRFGAHADANIFGSRRSTWQPQWIEFDEIKLPGETLLQQLDAGTLQPRPPSRGLYFRTVDPWGAGLPWVEATLHALEDDARAQRLRDLERRGNIDGWRPNLSTAFANDRADDPTGLTDKDLQRDRARRYVGADFERECKDDADLAFYLRTGAWYDSYSRLSTGKYGYHIDLRFSLTPGKKYVLYLWSNSRDDLQPDARIVFQATEVTDLGLITLPAYTE